MHISEGVLSSQILITGPALSVWRTHCSLGSFLPGALAVVLSITFIAATLVFSGEEFIQIARITAVAHLPLMDIEGIINVFVITLLKKIKPEILVVPHVVSQKV